MRSRTCMRLGLVSILLIGGCIVGDSLTTLTIQPDGSADLVVFRSNLRSTETASRAEKEIADYKAAFDSREEDEMARVKNAGGRIAETSWIKEQEPLSNFFHARLPNASVLEKYWTLKDEDFQLTSKFRSDGARRRLTIHLAAPPDKVSASSSSASNMEQLRQAFADGISETRIAVTNGSITGARGFTVANDKQSALLDFNGITELLRAGNDKAELYLEWVVTP